MNILEHHLQDALDALEKSLDPKIWRTKLRIQEIMLARAPILQENPFVTRMNHLLTLLVAGVQIGEIIPNEYEMIVLHREKFEEGATEPIKMEDIPQDSFYTTSAEFCEREYMTGMLEGLDYREIRDSLKIMSAEHERTKLLGGFTHGLANGRIFYRSVHTPKHRSKETLPALTVE